MQILIAIFSKLAEIPKTLGIGTTIWAIAGLLLLGLAIKFVERADKILERFQKRWRKMSPGARWVLIAFAVYIFGPTVWHAFPKGPGGIALVLGFLTFFVAGGLRHAQRYGLTDTTPAKAWQHHLEVSRNARKLTKAHADASAKKGGRARKPTPTSTGISYPMEPADGESPEELAEDINAGKHKAATARRLGWEEVKSQKATVNPDGTVQVTIDAVGEGRSDHLADEHWWDGR